MADELIARVICRLRGHRWEHFEQFKRRCERCGREEWMTHNPFPQIDQPAYFWQHMIWPSR